LDATDESSYSRFTLAIEVPKQQNREQGEASQMAKIRVLLTDDHTLFRQGIETLISAEPDMEVIGEAADGADAVQKASKAQPDVILMDIGMPGLSSFEATRQIKKNRPETNVLFLTMYDDEDYLVECMEMGASGYVLKDNLADQLVTAIRDVHRGGSYLSPRMLLQMVDNYRSRLNTTQSQPRVSTLTSREKEVLKLLAEGKCVKEIACEFNLSMKTIEAHKFNLMRRLDIHNKAQLVTYAIQKKIVRIRQDESPQ
jgi:DNA-binding NarL/FixJ family response regulator